MQNDQCINKEKELILAFEKVEYKVSSLNTSIWCNEKPVSILRYMKTKGHKNAIFITAQNPLAIQQSSKENRRQNTLLLSKIKKYNNHITQTYIDNTLDETGHLIYDLPISFAIELQKEFRQVGIIHITKNQPAQLIINQTFLSQNAKNPLRRE